MTSDIAVITSVFNPAGYKQPRHNFDRFVAKLEQDGVPWYAIELAFHDLPHSLPKSDNIFQFRSQSILWHKENLLNVLAAKLPPNITKIIWSDCDLIFSAPDWWKQASEALDTKMIIQPFETGYWREADGKTVYRKKKSFVSYWLENRTRPTAEIDLRICHPGFAWAARREFFKRGGLYPYNILGGGDMAMAFAFGGWERPSIWNDKVKARMDAYADEIAWVGQSLGYLAGISVDHMWHGNLKDRQLAERPAIIKRFDFDPATDISKDNNGMWQWATDKPEFHKAVKDYFRKRKEDLPWWRNLTGSRSTVAPPT